MTELDEAKIVAKDEKYYARSHNFYNLFIFDVIRTIIVSALFIATTPPAYSPMLTLVSYGFFLISSMIFVYHISMSYKYSIIGWKSYGDWVEAALNLKENPDSELEDTEYIKNDLLTSECKSKVFYHNKMISFCFIISLSLSIITIGLKTFI